MRPVRARSRLRGDLGRLPAGSGTPFSGRHRGLLRGRGLGGSQPRRARYRRRSRRDRRRERWRRACGGGRPHGARSRRPEAVLPAARLSGARRSLETPRPWSASPTRRCSPGGPPRRCGGIILARDLRMFRPTPPRPRATDLSGFAADLYRSLWPSIRCATRTSPMRRACRRPETAPSCTSIRALRTASTSSTLGLPACRSGPWQRLRPASGSMRLHGRPQPTRLRRIWPPCRRSRGA